MTQSSLIRSTPGRRASADQNSLFTLIDEPASLDRPISQACTARQFSELSYNFWCERIGEVPRMHRKQWEFCYIAQVLATGGALAPGRRGLGFGVGNEPLASVFAARGAHVIATDQAPEEATRTGWVATEQHAHGKSGLNQRGLCPPDLFEQNVEFQFADMNAIPADVGAFDFVWSACAFEHLGSIAAGHRFILESSRLLRPGGIAVHTTELNCSSNADTLDHSSTVLYRRRDFEQMARDLAEEGCAVEMTFDLGDEPLDQYVDMPPFSADNHLKLQIEKWVTTSFGLVIHKQ